MNSDQLTKLGHSRNGNKELQLESTLQDRHIFPGGKWTFYLSNKKSKLNSN